MRTKLEKPHEAQAGSQYLEFWLFFFGIILLVSCSTRDSHPELEVEFDGGYGQLEVGGKYVGVEFHQSRPLPSRISFYYPVANSIDLSTDYWQRHRSLPLTILLRSEGQVDTVGNNPYPYSYTPYRAHFENSEDNFHLTFSYDVCDDFPVLVFRMTVQNISGRSRELSLTTALKTSLRTSHTYAWKARASVQYFDDSNVATAVFNDLDTDSALVFIANAGELAIANNQEEMQTVEDPVLQFEYKKELGVREQIEIIQLIGMCHQRESDQIMRKTRQQWQQSVKKNEKRIMDYACNQSYFLVEDPILQQTAEWSKALLASNIHYIDGHYLPMPCPAEYNFFFTHDLLLTTLGAVYFDLDYAKEGFQFLRSLTKKDSVLAHAYFWKDARFVTEYCDPDNWNHLWFIITASSYLKHSSDFETLESIFPMLRKSLHLMLKNRGKDDLMYARRPDWWDTGKVYGARTYITGLMYKALQDYAFICFQLDREDESLLEYIQLAGRMKNQLVEKLWDDQSGFLFNMLDSESVDGHYYAGSLVAIYCGLLDDEKKSRLLQTVKDTLLDENIGVRNAMPPDFHELISVYNFKGMESGMPYFYFNGGVWPHGNAWYALGLLHNNQVEEAKTVLQKYLTLDGVRNSPNGQPSFYEYRITDPKSDRYGEIDKPSFLWAGGWYLHALYQLVGLRENSWNMYFSPLLPDGFEDIEYDLTLFGELCRIKWIGQGDYFHKISIDGQNHPSAIITSASKEIVLERGIPAIPYLAEANCIIENVDFSDNTLIIEFSAIIGQNIVLNIVSPIELQKSDLNGLPVSVLESRKKKTSIFEYSADMEIEGRKNILTCYFK